MLNHLEILIGAYQVTYINQDSLQQSNEHPSVFAALTFSACPTFSSWDDSVTLYLIHLSEAERPLDGSGDAEQVKSSIKKIIICHPNPVIDYFYFSWVWS